MSFLDLAKRRFSVRKYLPKPVEEEKLKRVLEVGRIAPSACNYQPWKFIVVTDPTELDRLSEAYPRSWFRQAPCAIIVCGDHSKAWNRSDGKDHCDVDAAIAADHLTLAAADEGLGTCWICAFEADKVREVAGIQSPWEPIVLLPLGYPAEEGDQDRHGKDRKDLNDIVQWGL